MAMNLGAQLFRLVYGVARIPLGTPIELDIIFEVARVTEAP